MKNRAGAAPSSPRSVMAGLTATTAPTASKPPFRAGGGAGSDASAGSAIGIAVFGFVGSASKTSKDATSTAPPPRGRSHAVATTRRPSARASGRPRHATRVHPVASSSRRKPSETSSEGGSRRRPTSASGTTGASRSAGEEPGRPERPKRSKHPGSDPRLSWARFASTEGSSDRKGRRRSRVANASSSSASSRGFWTRARLRDHRVRRSDAHAPMCASCAMGTMDAPRGSAGSGGVGSTTRGFGAGMARLVSARMRTNEVPRFEEAFSSSEGSSGRRRRSSCVVDANHRTSASARAPMGGRRQRMVERAASRCRRGRGSWSWSVRSREGRTCERFAVKHGRRVSRRPVRGVVRIEASHRDGASSGSRRPSAGCACRDGAAEGVPSFKVCRLSQRKSARAS